MPYIGYEWRPLGDLWVRTPEGWETLRSLRENIKTSDDIDLHHDTAKKTFIGTSTDNIAVRNGRHKLQYDAFYQVPKKQPFIIFSSKEKHGFTSLSDAIMRLDMLDAVQDFRRRNYMTKILFIVLSKLADLSGTSQKLVLNIVETMVNKALNTEMDIALTKRILLCAHRSLKEGKYRHIGSQSLWQKHIQTVDRLMESLLNYQIKERKKDGRIMLSDLPTDCLRHIFSRISDHRDILRAGQTSSLLNEFSEDSHLWKKMCLYHFNNQQLLTFLPSRESKETVNWKFIYNKCYKQFGTKDYYADMLSICCQCSKMYWKCLGHPCSSDEECAVMELSPHDFMALLKL